MTVQAKTIALVGKPNAAGIADSITALANFLARAGHHVVIEVDTAQFLQSKEFSSMPVPEIGNRRRR